MKARDCRAPAPEPGLEPVRGPGAATAHGERGKKVQVEERVMRSAGREEKGDGERDRTEH